MATTKTYLPPLVQSYDYSIKRLYKKNIKDLYLDMKKQLG